MDAYALLAALETARIERGSGVPLAWSDIAEEVGIHAAAFSRLKKGQLPGPRTLRAIMEWLEMSADEFRVIGDASLPIGGRDEEWDGEAATNRVFEWATKEGGDLDQTKLRQAFFFVDPEEDPNTRQAYKLPFCDISNDAIHIVPRGMSAVAGGHGVDAVKNATPAEKQAIKRKVCSIYKRIIAKYDDWPDCPFNPDGSRPERKERRNDSDVEGDEMETNANETPDEAQKGESEKTAGIVGRGSLSKSEDPRTQALVARVQELLREGAVAVSIKHDLHPEVSAKLAELEADFESEEEAREAMEQAREIYENAEIRPRHVAIVDTAAFSNARLTLGEDGYTVEGPVTFEGVYTGDVRTLKYGSLTWDEDLLPIPIIWDPENNDHDGVVVGYVSELERVDGMTTAVRPEAVSGDDVDAVVAAAGSSALPAEYFDVKSWSSKNIPLTVCEEDANGLRRVYGYAAPYGVCHRSDMGACFQYPKDVDKEHRGFHTGSFVTLSDGSKIRVGALTIGGKHIDPTLARQGVDFREVNRHRDDANTVFAMVRAWEGPHGLAVSGVVMPGVDQATLLRAQTCAPSVELWPAGRGRTLVGIHIVPTPAWPVAASAGGGDVQRLTMAEHIRVMHPEGGYCAECEDQDQLDLYDLPVEDRTLAGRLDGLESSLKRVESVLAILAKDALTDVPLPEDAPAE